MTTGARADTLATTSKGDADHLGARAQQAAQSQAVADRARYPHEWRCIVFLCDRDGLAGACDYCRRTAGIYRSAVLSSHKRGHPRPHFASLPEYRHKFIASYLDFKRFALACDRRHAE